MKPLLLLTVLLLAAFLSTRAQQTQPFPRRYIEVTGSSEISIDPDEILFIIRIKEYWKEEFEKKAKEDNYKTKIPIAYIEKELLSKLQRIGITPQDITVQEVGEYWRQRGKDFLIGKQFEIRLTDLKTIDAITRSINTNGVTYMGIGELKNKKIAQYRKQAKIEALQAAKEKAAYLLEGIGERLGEVISVTEPQENPFAHGYSQRLVSNIASAPESGSIENIRKIKLRYEMTARFGIR